MYEAQLRTDLLAQELSNNIERSAFVSSHGVNHLLALENQQREIAYGVVPMQDYLTSVTIDDADVKAYYDQNQSMYTAPEQIKLNYIELDLDTIAAAVEINETELKQFYADNQSQFVGPEQRKASHILIEGDDEQALAQIEAIAERIANGEEFAALAAETSQDTGSAAQGGDLGYFGRDVMDPAFEKAVFALQNEGDVSEPVKTEFGYHLIKLTGIQQPDVEAFDQVRAEVEKRYRLQQAETRFFDEAEQLANLSFENPDSLDVAAEALELDIKTTELFTRAGTEAGISSEDKVISAAFSDDVLKNELNSSVIELSDTHLVVLHKSKHIPETVLPFESVEPAIRQQLLFDKASQFAREKGEAILTELQSGADAESLVDNWQAAQSYRRDDDAASAQILQRAFAMPKPHGEAQYAGFTAENGNYVLIQLISAENGDPVEVADEDKQTMQQQLTQMQANAELQAFIAALRADADINIIDKSLR
jgi:peptidyl-prolyl cis-trans isomerase D